jgi:trehalose/maltose hydrolase-like predicted phosphorylase
MIAVAELERAEEIPADRLRRQQRAWWENYWSRSFIRIAGPNREAEWLNAAYYVHLYTLAGTNRACGSPRP